MWIVSSLTGLDLTKQISCYLYLCTVNTKSKRVKLVILIVCVLWSSKVLSVPNSTHYLMKINFVLLLVAIGTIVNLP